MQRRNQTIFYKSKNKHTLTVVYRIYNTDMLCIKDLFYVKCNEKQSQRAYSSMIKWIPKDDEYQTVWVS